MVLFIGLYGAGFRQHQSFLPRPPAGQGGAGRGGAGQGRAGMIKVVNVIAQVEFAYLPVLCVLSKLSVSVITAELWCG